MIISIKLQNINNKNKPYIMHIFYMYLYVGFDDVRDRIHTRQWGRCRDRIVVGFTTTYVISAYHH
jgi:hypothetical protein